MVYNIMSFVENVIIRDSEGNSASVDNIALGLIVIETEHNHIHHGHHFQCPDTQGLGGASIGYWMINTPDSGSGNVHLLFEVSTDDVGLLQFYEAPTLMASGAGLVEYDNNRQTANQSNASCYFNPTVIGDGTLLYTAQVAAGVKAGSLIRSQNEWLLQTSTNYLIKFTTVRATNVDVNMAWYEQPYSGVIEV